MNIRQIIGSSLISAGVGFVIGLAVAKLAAPEFVSQRYRNLPTHYPIAGAIVGGVVGACQSAILQLKQQRDQEETR
jgi:gas vesicle protein